MKTSTGEMRDAAGWVGPPRLLPLVWEGAEVGWGVKKGIRFACFSVQNVRVVRGGQGQHLVGWKLCATLSSCHVMSLFCCELLPACWGSSFRAGVKDLEVMTQNLITSAFETVKDVERGVEIQEIFHHLSSREVQLSHGLLPASSEPRFSPGTSFRC